MARIVAIDFETANNQANSACQLGVVVVENLEIVEEKSWLIRPPTTYFSPHCVRVHGITARDCVDAPLWGDVWPEVKALLKSGPVLGHNVGFDARVLLATCQHYQVPLPNLELMCSRLIAKKAWPQLTGFGLANVANHLDIRFRHHDALEDARASAIVAMTAAKLSRSSSIRMLEESLGMLRGLIMPESVQVPKSVRVKRTVEPVGKAMDAKNVSSRPSTRVPPSGYGRDGLPKPSADLRRRSRHLSQAILDRAQETQPLHGRKVVLVHTLLGLEKEEATAFLVALGAEVHPRINLQTQLVILGTPPEHQNNLIPESQMGLMDDSGADSLSERIQFDVDKRKSLGQSIHSLSQRQLFALIPSASQILRGE